MELFGNNRYHQIEIKFYPDSPVVHFKGFSASGQFEAAELIRNMIIKPLRCQPDQTQLMPLHMSGDVHPNPGPATKYPYPVCTRNATSRGVSYKCSRWNVNFYDTLVLMVARELYRTLKCSTVSKNKLLYLRHLFGHIVPAIATTTTLTTSISCSTYRTDQ